MGRHPRRVRRRHGAFIVLTQVMRPAVSGSQKFIEFWTVDEHHPLPPPSFIVFRQQIPRVARTRNSHVSDFAAASGHTHRHRPSTSSAHGLVPP